MPLKAVLFDMDGVLFDSMKFHAKAWHEAAINRGLVADYNEFYMHEGRTGKSTTHILYNRTHGRDATDQEIHDLYLEKSTLFTKYNDGFPMIGATDVIARAKANDLQILVVTGSGQRSLIDKLSASFPHCFTPELMVTAFDVHYGKPHPEPYLMGLEKAGVSASEAIVIENAPMGVQSAVAAGIFTIAANTGPLPNDVLLDAGAHLLYPSMPALADAWDEILAKHHLFSTR